MTFEFISARGLKVGRSGKAVTDSLGGRHISLSDDEVDALREYFQHEEKLKAQPWLDAKPGDVWVFEHAPTGNEQAYNVGEGPRFYRERGVEFHPKGVPIARAYRVWPTKEEE